MFCVCSCDASGAGTGAGAGQPGFPSGPDLEALLGGMQGGAFGGLGTGAPAVSNPEEAFATQLTQLEVSLISVLALIMDGHAFL